MLQIQHIKKEYRTGTLVQKALDDVSLNLRDNEFVAILGPSGSGKTTLLNIIGGLDRYDSGDLIINGISTKKYKDRDWDSYRNHTIGFVFQSYNLIPHQTVLANVELALTISGVSKEVRRKKAIAALDKVGLGKQLHKRPSQMSGGQMQRVAIARALVNDPEILLADEPTGALDSDTSIQVMDLLQEVAKERLVVMVTHNPELAELYANRIVTLRDGVICSDTNPFEPDSETLLPPKHKNMGKSSMSFLTALSLSFNNLRTKKARTLLTSFAGSIGIIGIALILALSSGVNEYIQNMEEETLSEYPLQIQSTGFDLTSMMVGSQNAGKDSKDSGKKNEIKVQEVVTNMFSTMNSNDLASLKKYLDGGADGISDYTNAIEYSYSVTPQIYREDGDSIRQVHPDQSFRSLGLGASSNSIMSSMMSTNVFYEMPDTASLYENQYDLKAGHWPENYNECVLVLIDSDKGIHIKTAVLIHGAEFLIRKDIDGGVRHLLFHNLGFLCFLHNVAGQRCRVIDAGGQGRGGRVRGRLDNTGDCELFAVGNELFHIVFVVAFIFPDLILTVVFVAVGAVHKTERGAEDIIVGIRADGGRGLDGFFI